MKDTLNARFRAPLKDYYTRRIIVWKDESGEFADAVQEMELENARILTMRENCMFEMRKQIEVDYAEENLLIYCPMAFEKPQDNWLLDVFLYSEEFRADYWSLLFTELNVENSRPMREYARSVSAFFNSRDRKAKLHALREKYKNERELQTGIFGVLCGAKAYGFSEVVRLVLSADTDEENACLAAISKFCGKEAFWLAVQETYGYQGKPDVMNLACHMLASAALSESDDPALPSLPCSAQHAMQAYGFFLDWLRQDSEGLAVLCVRIEEKYGVENLLRKMNRSALMRMSVFPAADRMLLESTLFSFAEGRFNMDDAETLLRERRDKPWHERYAAYYEAVRAIIDMNRFMTAYRGGFHYTSLKEIWSAYEKELCRMDQYYRAFCTAYDAAMRRGIMSLEDGLREAADAAERIYKNGFLSELNNLWTDKMASGELNWPGMKRQQDFYRANVAAADNRIYVVVSDGLRYEVAKTLSERLNGQLNGNTSCEAAVGMLPGITPVGMAALLPHRRLSMDDNLKIRCDELLTDAGCREKVLKAACAQSTVLDYAEFRQCSKAQRAELVRGMKVVYIYHNVIDRVGEAEGNIPQACEEAMSELGQLMRILVNELSASNVIITSDHGFLYTRSPLEEFDKADKDAISGEIMEYKRSYAIVCGSAGDSRTVEMSLAQLGREDLTAVYPRGIMRFRLQGGSGKYIHGGLSLQEMMIPVIRYQNKKSGQKGFTAITKTEIVLLGENRKISNNIFTLIFYQKEPCGGKVQPRRVKVRFEDVRGHIISDEHRLIGDMTSQENNARTMRTTFRLLGSGYDRNIDYLLIMTDEDEKTELARIAFRIDIVFENDFDF